MSKVRSRLKRLCQERGLWNEPSFQEWQEGVGRPSSSKEADRRGFETPTARPSSLLAVHRLALASGIPAGP